jgi:hypothetical protein
MPPASAEVAAAAPKLTAALSSLPLDEQVASILTVGILLNEWSFFYNGEEVPPDQVASPRCLLPAILWQAEKLHRKSMLGNSFGVRFQPDREAFIGAVPVLQPDANRPRGPLPLFCLEALHQVQEFFPMPNKEGAMLDPLVQAFFTDHDNGLLPWVDLDTVPTPRAPAAGSDVA